MKSMSIAALIAVTALGASPLLASSIIGPTYPAPGGNNFSSTGVSGDAGGVTLNYSTFDPTQYSQLWWGPASVQNVYNSDVASSGTGNMTFASYSSGVAEWNSSVNWTFTDAFGNTHSYATQFVLTFQPADSGDVTSQSAAGISGNPDSVLAVPGNYSVNGEFEAEVAPGVWDPVDQVYNSFNETCTGCVQTSFDGEFWYTAPNSATPEPGSLLLFGSGMLTLAGVFRRKVQRR